MSNGTRPGSDLAQDTLDQAIDRFEEAWEKGGRPVIEDFLPAEVAGRRDALVHLVHIELERRLKAGEAARAEEYLSRFPELAERPEVRCQLIAAEFRWRHGREVGSSPIEPEDLVPLNQTRWLTLPPSMPLRITFQVTRGPHQGKEFHFDEHDTFIVGRSKHAHLRLPQKDEYFSRVHFLVDVNPPHCRLLDMGSTNGTYVNGQGCRYLHPVEPMFSQLRCSAPWPRSAVVSYQSHPASLRPPHDREEVLQAPPGPLKRRRAAGCC
jgi:Inner membrane component of T3SS, cytoplasmic domain